MECKIQYYENSGRAWCGVHSRDESSCLRAKLATANLQFEEARKIIAEVSYSPEFQKWFYHGEEQDPCGVHAFTEKYAEKRVEGS